jgi:hypothetical protein
MFSLDLQYSTMRLPAVGHDIVDSYGSNRPLGSLVRLMHHEKTSTRQSPDIMKPPFGQGE